MLFAKSQNTQAYLKAGLMGLAGSGKTFTATNIAIGLIELMRKNKLEAGNRPALFLDTETGSDWIEPIFKEASIELQTAKTRAFIDLVPAIKESESNGSVLIIDSISHFWTELTESYAKKKNRKFGLQFQDWAWLKSQWRKFTDVFVNSNAHIILCGRAGYEYDYEDNESGRKELIKTGVKMKAEGEMGYEPSILIHLERHFDSNKKIYRTATVLKDRANKIDGAVFNNAEFKDFLPHINYLNLGGKHTGVDTARSSEEIISKDSKPEWQIEKQQTEIVLDEIQALLTKYFPSRSSDDSKKKMDLLEEHLGSRSWKRIETFKLQVLKDGYGKLQKNLQISENSC